MDLSALPLYDLDAESCKRIGVPPPFLARVEFCPDSTTMAEHVYDDETGERVAGTLSVAHAAKVD